MFPTSQWGTAWPPLMAESIQRSPAPVLPSILMAIQWRMTQQTLRVFISFSPIPMQPTVHLILRLLLTATATALPAAGPLSPIAERFSIMDLLETAVQKAVSRPPASVALQTPMAMCSPRPMTPWADHLPPLPLAVQAIQQTAC